MDRTQARETAKGMIEEYLRGQGIDTRRPFSCLNPEHTDNNPSMSLDRKHNRVKCFSCDASYDIFDLVRIDTGLTDDKAVFDETYKLLGLTVEDTPRRERPEDVFSDLSEEEEKGQLSGNNQEINRKKTGSNQEIPRQSSGNNPEENRKSSANNPDIIRQSSGQSPDKSGQYTHTHTDVYTHNEAEEQDYSAYYEACKGKLPETDYTRGLSPETLRRFSFGFDPAWRHPKAPKMKESPRLIIPTSPYSYLARHASAEDFINYRGEKENKSKVGRIHIFNLEALRDSSRPTFIVEGEIDAASIVDVGGSALALGSVSYKDLFLRELDRIIRESGKPTQPIIIALDNDTAGSKCAEDLAAELSKRGLSSYRRNPCGEYKDANEALMMNRDSLAAEVKRAEGIAEEAAEEEREAYLSTSAGAHLQDFLNGITESANTDAIPTGFPLLDRVLDGGLYEGLVAIGGISSLGKTSLIMQVSDQIAAAGYDVLIFSLEMSRTQLMSKSISRHTIQLTKAKGIDPRNAKTSRGITTGKRYSNYNSSELKLIQEAIQAYSEYADRIFIQEGVGDITVDRIRETVERHILITGGKWETNEKTGERRLTGGRRPLVVVDYLQIIAPHSDRATDKQAVDHAVLELKRISRDYKLPVIAISSFNRAGYKEAVTFEQLKESGSIEYSSDIVLGLQLAGAGKKDFDPTAAKRKNPREIELVILKNRDAAVGDKVAFNYYPMFNLFEEAGVS